MGILVPILLLILYATPCVVSNSKDVVQNNLCLPNPCQNGGVCSVNGSNILCHCPQGYSGQKCEQKTTKCSPNPCIHGICSLDKDNSPQCYCTPGYTGKFCGRNQNECASQPCRNGATCFDEINDYKCVCKSGTIGRHCETRKEDVEKCIRSCDDGLCWRNSSVTIEVSWGYGDNICSTQHSCFGGQNDSTTNTWDKLIDVQLTPLQIQLGDSLNFTADVEMLPSKDGLKPYRALDAAVNAFLTCNETDGKPIVQEPQKSVFIGVDYLKPGQNYFFVNVDTTFRCEFGLRLNVSVKENKCALGGELCSNRGQCHTNFSLPDFRCKCCDGFRGEFCEKVDYCFSKPCKNSGVCKNMDNAINGQNYLCVCQPGYEGRDCSIVTDMCSPDPCVNGAQCIPRINDFKCVCPIGKTGKTCAVDIDECSSDPCQNGGACTDGLGTFSCHCKPGFTGTCTCAKEGF